MSRTKAQDAADYRYFPKRQHKYWSHWCAIFAAHVSRLELPLARFAQQIGRSQQMVQAYAAGRARPPVGDLPQWADALRLEGAERERFLCAGHEAWTPEIVWARMIRLEAAALARPGMAESATASRLREAEATIAALVKLATEAEAVFYSRDVQPHQIRDRRERLGGQLRKAIEKYAKAPADPRVAEAAAALTNAPAQAAG